MKIQIRKISEIRPYEHNPRINDGAVDAVAASIREFGWQQPIVVDVDGVIIAGHTRYKAAQKMGLLEVPVVVAENLTSEQVKAYRLADNKTGELAEWDFDELDEELAGIGELDMSQFGFETATEDEPKEAAEDDYDEPLPETPKAKLGEIYRLGRHRLMCGDSTSMENIEKLLDGEKIDMIFTDPPYNVAFNGRSGKFDIIENDNLSEKEFENFINKTVNAIKAINAPVHYVWCNWAFYGILQQKLDYKACIVWAKNTFGMGNGYRHQHEFCLFNGEIDKSIKNETDLWEIKKDYNYVHPTQKPVELSYRAIGNHSNVKAVLDLFGGSGSTLIGCEQRKVRCYMMELDPKYIDVIIDRWEKFTGEKAEKLNG